MPVLRAVPVQNSPRSVRSADGDDGPGDGAEALADLYRECGRPLFAYLLKLTLGDRGRAEDILQETMLRAWRHRHQLVGGHQGSRPWLFTVARHIAIDQSRARGPRSAEVGDEWLEGRPDPGDHLDTALTRQVVRTALATLTTRHREVLYHLYFDERSVEETARLLGVPVGTVKSRSHYALRALRAALGGHPSGAGTPEPPPVHPIVAPGA